MENNVLSLDELKEKGFEAGENPMAEIENKLEIEIFLKRLSERQRKVVTLILEGYTHEEIAKKLKVSKHTVDREMATIKKMCAIIR